MNKDLRTFMEQVQKLGADYFVTISKEVDPKYEPGIIQQKLTSKNRSPVTYFERMKGSKLPLVTNLFCSYDLLGLALGIEPGEPKRSILKRYRERMEHPIAVKEVPKSKAPVKEVVLRGEEIDLGAFPIVHHAEKDSGKYITIGCLITRDPETGILNAGVYRHELQGKDLLGCMFNPAHHAAYIYRKHKELNKPMPAVLFLGHHPAVVMGSLTPGLMEMNELEVMGGLLGEPLEVVEAETVNLVVPAFAEIAIEGVLFPDKETGDGPFAEYTGYYGPPKKPIGQMKVTAITMRKDAIYHNLGAGQKEHNLSYVLSYESSIYDSVKRLVPSVTGVYLPPSGCCLFLVYVSIKKKVPGEGKAAGLAALSGEGGAKMVVVVDDDIDVYNEEQVLWALSTRFEADQDLTVIPNILGAHLDPSSYGEIRTEKGPMTTKLIFDATRPTSLPFAERIAPPKDVWDRIKLEDYIKGI